MFPFLVPQPLPGQHDRKVVLLIFPFLVSKVLPGQRGGVDHGAGPGQGHPIPRELQRVAGGPGQTPWQRGKGAGEGCPSPIKKPHTCTCARTRT
jgi:hypothetical protein